MKYKEYLRSHVELGKLKKFKFNLMLKFNIEELIS